MYKPIYGFTQGMILGKEVDGKAVYLTEEELQEAADKLNKLEENEAPAAVQATEETTKQEEQ